MTYKKTKIKEIPLRFYSGEEEIIKKLERMKSLFNEKTETKTIKKIIREFKIN